MTILAEQCWERSENTRELAAQTLDFLRGGGLGALMRHDWGSTPLGPPQDWPQSLKTAADPQFGPSDVHLVGPGLPPQACGSAMEA